MNRKLIIVPAIITVVFFLLNACNVQEEISGPILVELHQSNERISFRGLHATHDTVVIVGGSSGNIGISTDAGLHWSFTKVIGAEESQFRSVWAHDSEHFTAVTAGAPSYIYSSRDAGENWSRVYSDTAESTFLDGIVFLSDRVGYVFGDPVDGRFIWLETINGGDTWTPGIGPESIDGEAAFAASGSAITYGYGIISIVTGGSVSRMHTSSDSGKTWLTDFIELQQGLPSQGAFAQLWEGTKLYIVGGDYLMDSDTSNTAIIIDLATGEQDDVTLGILSGLPYTSDAASDGQYIYFTGTQGIRALDTALHIVDTTAMHALTYSGKYVFSSGPEGRISRIYTGDEAGLNTLLEKVKNARKE
tara:strand:- start:4135 stop:5217 length:1083 start_codon:yes stop_codon:yes gene_type:complete